MAKYSEEQIGEYLAKRITTEDFTDQLQIFLDNFYLELLQTPLAEFFKIQRSALTLEVDQDALKNINRLVYLLIQSGEDLLPPYLRQLQAKPKDFLDTENYNAIGDLISTPVAMPPEILDKIIKQPAMQNLFIDVIHDAIIAFNKKYNPLFGAMSAMGLDKQIKGFIQPFMDQAMEITKSFVSSSSNQGLIKEFILNIYHVMMDQSFASYAENYQASKVKERKDKAYTLANNLTQDATLFRKSKEEFSKLIDYLEAETKDMTMEKLAQKYHIDLSKPQISRQATLTMAQHLQSKSAIQFLTRELNLLQEKLG